MKKHIKHIAMAAALMGVGISTSTAQELRTSYFMETSNFRHQMNPALLDQAYIGMPLLGNINIGTTGNVGAANFIYHNTGANSSEYPLTTFMSPEVSASQFLNGLNDKNRLDIYTNLTLLSVAFRGFGGVNLIELNTRSNSHITMPYEMFEFMKTTGSREQYDLSGIGMRSHNYAELALGHSRAIGDKWRVGAKMKLLFGLAYADLTVDRMNVTLNGNEWKVDADARMQTAVMSSYIEHDNSAAPSPDGRPKFDDLEIEPGLGGFGVAFDLGATYKPIRDLELSVGLTDLGFISWSKMNHASSAGTYSFSGFEEDIYVNGTNTGTNEIGDQFEQMGDELEELFSVYDDGQAKANSALAATLNIGAQYTLPAWRKLRFGFLYTSRIHGKYSWHEGMLSVNCRPTKWFEVAVNGAATSTGCTVGALVNLHAPHFNFYIGADRFMGKVSKDNIPLHNLNSSINFGMTFPLK